MDYGRFGISVPKELIVVEGRVLGTPFKHPGSWSVKQDWKAHQPASWGNWACMGVKISQKDEQLFWDALKTLRDTLKIRGIDASYPTASSGSFGSLLDREIEESLKKWKVGFLLVVFPGRNTARQNVTFYD